MLSKKTKVLIVDDSALVRQVLTAIFARDRSIEVVGVASDPIIAWDKIRALNPDVVTLDVEMPRMDGLTFLEKLMRARPTPVVMVSSLTEKGCETTLRALELGAVDFVTKPKIDVERGTAELSAELLAKVRSAAMAKPRRLGPAAGTTPEPTPHGSKPATEVPTAPRPLARTTHKVIAVGASTGGTEALREFLTELPPDAPGVVIVQHMPAGFTRAFATRLDGLCRVNVAEARDGDPVLPGHVLIAPGDLHMKVQRSGANTGVRIYSGERINHHRPSVDVLFQSCAQHLGANAVGVILTGMGSDGARGLLAMRQAGARTIGQDEASCVVFGMPKEAIAMGAVQEVVPLEKAARLALRMAAG